MIDMSRTAQDGRIHGLARTIVVFGLLTLVGINLRTVILAVPPILPLIKHDLELSYTMTGLLTALPVLVMGGAAWPSGILAGRIGGRLSVALGLALLGAGALLRAVWPGALPLFIFTGLLSLGIALAQTSVPVLTRQWFPTRIGLASVLYSDGLIFGEALSSAITVPIMVSFLGQDAWRATLVLWSIPVAAGLAMWLWLAPPAPPLAAPTGYARTNHEGRKQNGAGQSARPRVGAWHLGILIGSGSLIYFGMNGWIASYNQALSHPAMTPAALATLNAAQLPVSLAMTPFAQRLAGRRWPFIAAGIICAVALIGWVTTPIALEPLWGALLGGSSAFVFVLGIALPSMLATRETVASLTGATFTISYGVAFLGPLAGGALWDLFHLPALAFLPVVVAGLALVILGAVLPHRSSLGLLAEDMAHPSDASGTIVTKAPAS